MFWHVLSLLALAAWFGGGIIAGFVAPQAAFSILADRQLAGSIAGRVLGTYTTIEIVAASVYCLSWVAGILSSRTFHKAALILVILALVMVLYGHFVVDPKISTLREQIRAGGETPVLKGEFGALHRASVILFGIEWLLVGCALVVHIISMAGRSR